MASRFTCQARILNKLFSTPVAYWTTKECEAETNKRISVDSGEAYMSICSCCFKRFIKRSMEKQWYGWFDCEYPPEAPVVGSKWFYENVKHVKHVPPTPTVVEMVNIFDPEPTDITELAQVPEVKVPEPEPEPEPEVKQPEVKMSEVKMSEVKMSEVKMSEVAALEQQMDKLMIQGKKDDLKQPEVKVSEVAGLEQQMAKLTIQDKKDDLKRRIKEIQANARPGKMTMKQIQAAFKEITDLKAQIHML